MRGSYWLLVALVSSSFACRKPQPATDETPWQVEEAEFPPVEYTPEPVQEETPPVPPLKDRPPPDWDASEDAIKHLHEDRTHEVWVPQEEGTAYKRFGTVSIIPISFDLSLTGPDQEHEIDPGDYRVRIRFPDFAADWHEFEVKTPSGICPNHMWGENFRLVWHVRWGDYTVVVAANLPTAAISLRLFASDPPPFAVEQPWYHDLFYAEIMFLSADSSRTARHATRAEEPEIAPGGEVREIVFEAPAFGTDYCPPAPRKGGDE